MERSAESSELKNRESAESNGTRKDCAMVESVDDD